MDTDIRTLLAPASVAVIGASDNPNKVGGRPLHYMKAFGYQGELYPVNPGREQVQGLRCYPSLDAIDAIPDAAIIAVSGSEAMQAVEQCARRGIRHAVVMSSGFAETGREGGMLQEKLVHAANAYGMRLIGPNAQGIANFATGAVLNFSTMFMEVQPMDGPIAIVSQSGAASVMPYAMLREMGIGVRYLAATGNDADLGVAELARAVALDETVKVILVYVESITRPRYLAEAAAIARARGASIILLKGGASERGAKAAASHTGAMMGHDGALDAFLQRHGIWRARDLHELVNAVPLYLTEAHTGEGRTVVMSHSGAVGVMCADAADRAGLALADLSEDTRARLTEILPGFATAANPLDLTAALMGNGCMFGDVLNVLAQDPQADMFLVGVPVAGPGYNVPELAATAARCSASSGKAFVVSAPQASVRDAFKARGLPVFRTETDAVHALRQYAQHRRPLPAARILDEKQAAGVTRQGLQSEADSLRLLKEAGVPVVDFAVCGSADEAESAFRSFGGAVV
ncbi:acetate--CoA ligase family protein, partial [Noviherbaspirillum denitrificans]|uniref:acetate--CoA ligase family protein n=1 Tax=Noviherbaspirillum denitrificans TaxID=1968433 RepID=UPI000B52F52D